MTKIEWLELAKENIKLYMNDRIYSPKLERTIKCINEVIEMIETEEKNPVKLTEIMISKTQFFHIVEDIIDAHIQHYEKERCSGIYLNRSIDSGYEQLIQLLKEGPPDDKR